MKQGEGLCCDEYDIMFLRPSVNDTIYILCDNEPSNVHYAKSFVQSCFQSIASQELFGVLPQGCLPLMVKGYPLRITQYDHLHSLHIRQM